MTFTKAALTSCLTVAVVGCATALAAPVATAAPEGQRIVLLVPGQEPVPGTTSLDQYKGLEAKLTALGYTVYPVPTGGLDLVKESQQIKAAADRATAGVEVESLSIIAHSYGGLNSRNYIKNLGGADVVDNYIAIGSPQYGTPGGCLQLPGFGFDGCPFTQFMADLNKGDDTPGAAKYYSIRSAEEFADGRLDGGQCRVTPIPNLAHIVEPSDERVQNAVVTALDGTCDGQFVTDADGSITWDKTVFPAN
ncbi:esterase/lipase family protein [Antrihabitans sp. NCIMB 15449]|uniref:Esterase/lipase family protein n=1 Tax=Antrihabitans spumae TaxID=3373370 RepID=A0ABW7JTS3_9NOCA